MWKGTVSLTLVKCHWNKLHFVYLIHALNQERQVWGRLNFYKCNVFLPNGKHNSGEIPQILPTTCSSAIHIVARVATKLSLNKTSCHVQDPLTVLSGCWQIFLLAYTQNHLWLSPNCSVLMDSKKYEQRDSKIRIFVLAAEGTVR